MDHATALAAARDGDHGAWEALVDEYSGLLWSIARAHRLQPVDAHDAIQTTWLRLVENLDRIADPQRLPGWLATTARRECLHVLRRAGRERPAASEDALDAVVDPAPPPDAALLQDERDRALWRAFAALGDACQRLLRVLMASPPPAYADVAVALDIAVGTIGPARQRCLKRLRAVMDADDALAQQLGGEPA